MKVLITGGAGFIGSHLADRLLAGGAGVLVLDDLSTGRLSNIEHLIGRPRFEYRIGSALDEKLVAEFVDRSDCTVHLAAAVGVRLIVEQPVHTIRTNLGATEIVLEASEKARKLVLVASTSEVYGKSTRAPFSEDDDLSLGPTSRSRWAYACSKALDEWLALAYMHERGVPVIIARLFNTVGPRQVGQYGMVLPNFARQALCGEPITVFGDGTQQRCFGHVDDSVEALARLLATPGAIGEVCNLGATHEVSMLELAHLVRARAGSESEIRLVPYDQAYTKGFEDMPRRVPDITKMRRLIDFEYGISLETIVDDVIEDRRGRLAQQESSAA